MVLTLLLFVLAAADLTPSERSIRARIAAHKMHAAGKTNTAPGTYASNVTRFEKIVDPDGVLDPAERARRAEHERKAYFQQLALKSAKARRKKAS